MIHGFMTDSVRFRPTGARSHSRSLSANGSIPGFRQPQRADLPFEPAVQPQSFVNR